MKLRVLNMKLIVVIIMSCKSFYCFSQTAFIEKIAKGNKAHLAVVLKNGETSKRYFASCSFKEVTLLPNPDKIRLINELFKYIDDTTICYVPTTLLSNHYTGKNTPLAKEYNLQIDALILINYIAFSSSAFIYSPYPLLYDKETKKEICCYSNELMAVIDIYKKWVKKINEKGFIDYCYPLWNNKYEWFGSKTKQKKFNEYPVWSSFYDCREMN